MEERKRILMVHNYYQLPGGEDTVVANEKKMLEERGHKVILYTRNNNELVEMNIFRKLLLPLTSIYNPRTARDIKRIIKEENIDIVHVHNTLPLISPSVYYAALKMKKPVIQTIHNFRLLCPGATFYRDGHVCEECVQNGLFCAVKHHCYRGSTVQTLICVIGTKIHRMTGVYGKINYICLTEFNREKLLEMKQIDEKKVFIKPNFVETDSISISVPKRKNQFIFAGRLEGLKGVDLLLKAWKQMGLKGPELIVCGTGPLENWCKEFVHKNKLANIKLMGFVNNEDACKLMGISKALILPTQCYEGFPVSIVEAFSVGTPVICSDFGNTGSIVIEGINGAKFRHSSKTSLIEAVNRILKYSDIQKSTYKVYLEKYTIEKNYDTLMDVYKDITVKIENNLR